MKSIVTWIIIIIVLVMGFQWIKDRSATEMPALQEEEVSQESYIQ